MATKIFILLLALATLTIAGHVDKDDRGLWDFGVQLTTTANSTTAHLFTWIHRENNVTLPQIYEFAPSITVSPGLDSLNKFINQTTTIPTPELDVEVGDYFAPITSYLREKIHEDHHEGTVVFLKAVDGLADLNRTFSNLILDSARRFWHANTSFAFKNSDFQIITGREQAIFTWISVNGLSEILQHPNGTTIGAISSYGKNMSLAFETHKAVQGNVTIDFKLARHFAASYNVFAARMDSYGLEGGWSKYAQSLIAGRSLQYRQQTSPCAFTGAPSTWVDHTTMWNYTLHGTGDWSYCLQFVGSLFNKHANCSVWPCVFDGIYSPPLQGNFIATDDIFTAIDRVYIDQAPQSDTGNFSTGVTLAQISAQAAHLCVNKTWADVLADPKLNGIPAPQLARMCFDVAYTIQFLNKGFGVPMDATNVHYAKFLGVNNTQVHWSYGAMLFELAQKPVVPSSASILAVSSLIFISFFQFLLH